jgi:ABC-type uncharacterized transport system substrate-binding protein
MKLAARFFALALTVPPVGAAAHPHIFVDTTVEVIFDDAGRITALRIGWTYDELTTLLVVEDGGHDKDGDGSISDTELVALKGFDMEWGTEFLGDTYPEQNGVALALEPGPVDWTTGWANGRLQSTHLRHFVSPVDPAAGPVVIKPYDPGYYSAYAISGDAVMTGRDDCQGETFVPDLDAAESALLDSLKEYLPGDDLSDVGFPQAGETFAEELRITCGP